MSRLSRLVVLDVTSPGLGGRLLVREARRLAAKSGTVLLLRDPYSRTGGTTWGVAEMLSPARFVTEEVRSRAHEWTHAASNTIVAGESGLIPTGTDADLARLLRIPLETYLVDYALLAVAVVEAHRALAPREVVVLTADRSVAAALASVVPAPVRRVRFGRPRHLASLLRHLPWTSRSASRDEELGASPLFREAAARVPRPRVLMVAESRPMAQMFDAIEPSLEARGIRPRMRLQYYAEARPAGFELTPQGGVLSLRRPDSVPTRNPYRFLGALPDALARVRQLESSAAHRWLGGPMPLEFWLENMYLDELAAVADHAARARDILATLQPELLIVGNDRWWLGQSFVQAAARSGIPSLWVQDGTSVDAPIYYWMTADRLAASSAWLVETLVRHGVGPDRCRITGQPRYDALVGLARTADRSEVRRQLGLKPDARYALVATQPLQGAAYAREVVEALLGVEGLEILLRPHPSQDHAPLAAVAAQFAPERVSFRPRDSVFDLLVACDFMVNQFSTVTIEAAILGRPVITANFSGLPDPVPYARFGLSTAAQEPSDITRLAARILGDEGRGYRASPEGLRLLVGPVDGGSAERVASMIADTLAARGP